MSVSQQPIVVDVALGERAYDIAIGRGVIAELGPRITKLRPGAIDLTFDYQLVARPGYNSDRGPVNLFATRLHAEF